MESALALVNPPILGLRRRKETPQSWEGAQHPSEGLATGVATGRGKHRPGAEDASPALTRSICSRHPPHGAPAMPLAWGCLAWTRSKLLLSLPWLPSDKGGMSGGEPG